MGKVDWYNAYHITYEFVDDVGGYFLNNDFDR